MRKIYVLLLASLFAAASLAQTVFITTGTAGTPAYNAGPIYRSSASSAFDASRYAYLYTASELAAAGITPGAVINLVGWVKNNTATTLGVGGIFRIYMKNTSATDFSLPTETWVNLNTGATLVYENLTQVIPATANPDYIDFPLTTSFVYTGGSLEICTEWDINQVAGNASTGTFEWLWSTVVDRIYGTGNTTLAPITTLSSTTNSISTIDNRRPFIKISYTGGTSGIDLGAESLVTPAVSANDCYTSAEIVTIRIRNYSIDPIDLSANPVTITTNVTGAVTQTLSAVVNTGMLAPAATLDVPMTGTLNMSATGVYTFNASAAVSGDVNAANDAMIPVNITKAVLSAGTASASPNQICVSGTPTLSATGGTGYGSVQWQQSTTSGSGFTDIPGATSTTHVVGSPITQTMYYQLQVSCNGVTVTSNEVTVIVNSPQITSTTPGGACEPGPVTVTLGATGTGSMINWYDVPTGGMPIGTGPSFTTPPINASTTYYVSTGSGGIANVGLPGELAGTSGAGTTNFGLVFDALAPFTLNTVVVYPVSTTAGTAGTVTIDVVDGTGAILHTATVNVIGNPAASATAQTVTLNFPIVPGTNLKLRPGSRGPGITGLLFEPSATAPPGGNYGYPFVVPGVVSINHSTLTAPPTNTPRLDLYYYFYNWEISTGCESARTPVLASVNPLPSISSSVTQPSTCISSDGAIDITISGTSGPYTFAWTGNGVNPTSQNQTGLSVGLYSVTVTDVPTGCVNSVNIPLSGPGGCSSCPTIGSVTAIPSPVCTTDNITFTASGLADMDITYGITFKYSSSALPDPYVGGTVIGTVPNASLGGGGTTATLNGTIPTGGNYFVYAILSPTPVDPLCRPSASTSLTVNPTPDATVVSTPGTLQVIITGNGNWADEITWTLRNASNTIILSGGPYGLNPPPTPSATVPANNAPFSFFIEAQGTFNDNSCLWEVRCDGVVVASGCIRGTSSGAACANVGTLTVNNISGCGAFANQTICTGNSITPISFTSTVPGTIFNWVRDNVGTVTGSIGASGTGTITGTLINSTTAPITVTFTITPEANGCFGTPVTATVTVNPTPTITCPANITVNNSPGQCGAFVNYPPATVTGTPAPTVTYSHPSGSLFPIGTTTVTATASNACGTATCTFTVTVNDTQPPTITCPANITVGNAPGQCGATVTYNLPGVSDNCPLPGAITLTQSTNNTTLTAATGVACTAAPNQFWRAYDLSTYSLSGPLTINSVRFGVQQNTTAQTVNVRVYTSAGPFPASPRTLIASTTVPITTAALVFYTANFATPPTVATNAIVAVEVESLVTVMFPGANALGQTAPSYLSSTACGLASPTNVAGPPINFPNSHYVIDINGSTPSAATVSLVSGLPSGSVFPVGTTTNVWMATDAAGNTSTCSFTVTVNDIQAPLITCPANITATTPVGSCTAVVTYNVTATDNCPGVTTALVSGPASGSAFPLGTTTVTWRATDASGNTSTCSFTVTVNDGQIPVISTQPANADVCAGSNAVFSVTAAPLAGPNNLTYQWQVFNGTTFVDIPGATSATLTVPNVTMAMAGTTYRVRVIGLCTTITSGMATLTVKAVPAITLSVSRDPALIPGQLVNITASVSVAGGTIQWFKNGVAIPGAVMLTLSNLGVDDAGTYHAVYTAQNGCSVTSSSVIVTKASSSNVFVYPNPNNGQFQVRVFDTNSQITISVYDSKGAMVYQRSESTGTTPYTRIDVNMSGMAAGHYVVDVRDSGGNRIGYQQVVVWR